jgi:hypothetical protein
MRVGGIWRGCGLSQTSSRLRNQSQIRRPHFPPQPLPLAYKVRMGSTKIEAPEWSAVRVRETFLDYFKQNDHTLGLLARP